jgi:hypothetical protein
MLLLIDKARLESKILSLLNSGITGNEPTDLTCAVFNINSKNGYLELDKSIAMETKKLNMLVDGSVDLRTEKLDLLIKPSVQEGLRTGVAQIIAGLTKISGNFNSPSVAIDTSGAAKKALSIGAALLTGGVSMLGEKVATTMIEDKNPCYTALENTKYYGMYKNASVQQERKTKKTTKKKPKKPEDIIKGIGGALLKSLGNKKNNDGGSSSKKASSPKDFLNNLGGFLGQ